MNKLSRDGIRALGDGTHHLRVKLSLHSRRGSPDLVYEGPCDVHLCLRQTAYKKHAVGEIIELSFDKHSWASYTESSIDYDGTCNTEEFLAELFLDETL